MTTELQLDDDVQSTPVYSWPELRSRWGSGLVFPHVELEVIRHGETDLNSAELVTGALDVPLSDTGRAQARQLGLTLRPSYHAMFASSQRRSIETLSLALLARGINQPFEADSRLNERSLGVMEGQPRFFVPQFAAGDLDFAPEGGESYRSVVQRCLSFFLDLHTRTLGWPPDRQVLICSHMGPLRVMVAAITGEPHAARMMAQEWKNALKFRLTVTRLEWPAFLGWHTRE
ncbi:MAG TPA: histidine phosphatase family protein [Thermoanaerobaculia bacterium]|nr:histidine phosphatase family protein [Thermoanaerobaculia bacterium]